MEYNIKNLDIRFTINNYIKEIQNNSIGGYLGYMDSFSDLKESFGVDKKDIEEKIYNISCIRKKILSEENIKIYKLFSYSLDLYENEALHILELCKYRETSNKKEKRKIEDKCFSLVKKINGDLYPQIISKANYIYNKKEKTLNNSGDKISEYEELLKKNIYNADDIVKEFNSFFLDADLNCCARLDYKVKNITFSHKTIDNNFILKVPVSYAIDGLSMLKYLFHESKHVITTVCQKEILGLGTMYFGNKALSIKEGIAVLSEIYIENIASGRNNKSRLNPYYVLTMQKIKENSNDGKYEVDRDEIFDFIFNLIKNSSNYNEKEIEDFSNKILRRAFRGVPGNRHYNPRDKIYFEGEMLAFNLREKGLLKYFEQCSISPEILSDFLDLNILSQASEVMIMESNKKLLNVIKKDRWRESFLKRKIKL